MDRCAEHSNKLGDLQLSAFLTWVRHKPVPPTDPESDLSKDAEVCFNSESVGVQELG